MWEVQYSTSVLSWLEQLGDDQLKSVAKELKLVELCGNQLRHPHSKCLGGGLFELRERRFGLRLYYCFKPKGIIFLTHAGDKGTQKKDIVRARKLLTDIRERESEGKKL